tara:strand:- start:1013 stop:1231 length:219 start_codon:yes stop_codon:yes gene_type:complete
MSEVIEGLSNLPVSEQERILSKLSQDLVPVEIDNKVYLVPREVDELIDSLSAQVMLLTEYQFKWQKKEKLKM